MAGNTNIPMIPGPQDQEVKQTPPVPPRPNDQYYISQRYNHYGAINPYGPPNPYFAVGPTHNMQLPIQFISNANQQIDATFQSIQSVVQAFSSISMMLESTYMAVHSSFRAVMDVADHLVRLKDGLSTVMSLGAIFNTIKWFYRRILYMFNLINEEEIWSDSLARATSALEQSRRSITDLHQERSSWPMLMFLGVALGGPYLIYQLQKPSASSSKWITQESCHYIGEALYDFTTNQENEISLRKGQRVIIAPKECQPRITDWLLASVDGKRAGLIPMNYVQIIKFEIVE